jgi:hypothetical protein
MTLLAFDKPWRGKQKSDRRMSDRFPVGADGQLFLCPAGRSTPPLHVHVRDVSDTGVGVVYGAPLPLGQKYVVKQPAVARRGGSVLFTVVRSEKLPDGTFTIGLHASHLLENTFVHTGGTATPARAISPATQRMARLLIGALVLGVLAAMTML